jgi:branched-chain amino acid transport system ATP-binding protein
MAEPLLDIRGLSKRFGGVVATDSLDLTINAGEIHAVIGPNGAGKSTLIGQIAGELRPDAGAIRFAGVDQAKLDPSARARRGLARTFQTVSIFPQATVRENVAMAVQAHAGHSFRFWQPAAGDPALAVPAGAALADVGLEHRAGARAGDLSHGEQRTLEIAMVLATAPRLILLDEPMAGLGPGESDRMVRLLGSLRGRIALLLVEHDMDAVFALADRITVLVYGRAIASGLPAKIRADAQVRTAYLGEEDAA